MSTLLYDHSQKLFKEVNKVDFLGRRVRVYSLCSVEAPRTDLNEEMIIADRAGNGTLKICYNERKNKPTNNYYATDLELEPETKEEIELELKDQESVIAEIKEKFICLEQLKVDKIDRKSFKIWKLIRVIMNEKDEKELIKILTEHIKA